MSLSDDFGIGDQILDIDRVDLAQFLIDKVSSDGRSPLDQFEIFRRKNNDTDFSVQFTDFSDRNPVDGNALAAGFL